MAVVTVYSGARSSNVPVDSADLEWSEFCDEIEALANELTTAPEKATPKEQKRRLVAWSPHRLRIPYRLLANVDAVTMLVLDVDNDKTPEHVHPEPVAAALEAAGVAALLYESPSSTAEHPKFRVIVPITSEIAPDDCRATRFALAEALGLEPGCGVEGAIDASKIFFAGRLHDTEERRVWRVEGEPLDASTLPAPELAWGSGKAPAVDLTPLADLPAADAGVAAALGDWRAHQGRKFDMCGAVGGVLRKFGYSRKQCEATLREWLPSDEPSVDVSAGVAWALQAWTMPSDEVSGFKALAELVGAQHAEIVESAVEAGSWLGRLHASRVSPTPWAKPAVADDPLGRRLSFSDPEIPLEYYCEGLRLAPSDGKISLIAGLPGAGKGPLADYLAICFTFGLPAFGRFPCRKSRVLVLDCEGARLTMRRMRRMCRALGVDARELSDPRDVSGVMLLSDKTFYAIQAEAPEVVILDSYTSAMMPTGLDARQPEFAQLAAMLGALDVLVISVAHANKAPLANERPTLQQVSGSGALASYAQTGVAVWHPDDERPEVIRVACMRAPETSFPTIDIEFTDTANDGLALHAVDVDGDAARSEAVERAAAATLAANRAIAHLRQVAPRPRAVSVITESVGWHKRQIPAMLQILTALERAGWIACHAAARADQHGTYLIRAGAPSSVVVDADGTITATERAGRVGGFRRP